MTEEQRKNRVAVIALLRDRSRWPAGFTWDFKRSNPDCGCAIPLTKQVLGFYPHWNSDDTLGLSDDESHNIFMYPGNSDYLSNKNAQPWKNWAQWTADWNATTPEDVARKLEATLCTVTETATLPDTNLG